MKTRPAELRERKRVVTMNPISKSVIRELGRQVGERKKRHRHAFLGKMKR